MSIEAALTSQLAGHAGLSALVGARIGPSLASQEASRPLVTYERISSRPINDFAGYRGITRALFRIDAVADSMADALAVRAQIRAALDAWSSGGVPQAIRQEESQGYAEPLDDASPGIAVASLTVAVWRSE